MTAPWGWVAARVLAFALLSVCASEARGQIAVIVHPDNSAVEDLSMQELHRIYLGQVTAFPDGTRITLLQTPGADTTFFRSILDRSVRQVKQHWIGVLLSRGAGTPPTELSVEEAVARVAGDRRAISFVPMPIDEHPAVKVLRINGRKPSDADYAVR